MEVVLDWTKCRKDLLPVVIQPQAENTHKEPFSVSSLVGSSSLFSILAEQVSSLLLGWKLHTAFLLSLTGQRFRGLVAEIWNDRLSSLLPTSFAHILFSMLFLLHMTNCLSPSVLSFSCFLVLDLPPMTYITYFTHSISYKFMRWQYLGPVGYIVEGLLYG